ncbi:hypothetical protein JXA47_11305 [Candidatus Sumerlaeota bacterium]|nr:hypothetical protein [Candidatus Sumerlaeota bacterium]
MSRGKDSRHRKRKEQAKRQREAERHPPHAPRGVPSNITLLCMSPTSLSGILGRSYEAERYLFQVRRLVESNECKSIEEANALLAQMSGFGWKEALDDSEPPTPEEDARELAYRAMEATDLETAVAMAMAALEIDLCCVDAMTVLAQVSSRTDKERIEHLGMVVDRARVLLGEEFFEKHRGEFWRVLETRPYMRARQQLADLLWLKRRFDEAIAHFEGMLDLNPDDNQGVRAMLLSSYLTVGNLGGARRLFREYSREDTAFFLWGRVLERLLAGDERAARSALATARRDNPFVQDFLIGKRRRGNHPPSLFEAGDEDEARCCAFVLGPAWKRHREAKRWLKAQAETT